MSFSFSSWNDSDKALSEIPYTYTSWAERDGAPDGVPDGNFEHLSNELLGTFSNRNNGNGTPDSVSGGNLGGDSDTGGMQIRSYSGNNGQRYHGMDNIQPLLERYETSLESTLTKTNYSK
jgi:hypothetical protein